MPSINYPKSDTKRIEFVRHCLGTAKKDIEMSLLYLPQELIDQLETTQTRFESSYQKLDSKLSDRQKQVREKNEAMTLLEQCVRDFFEVFKRRTYRLKHPSEVLRFYGVTLSGDLPDISNDTSLLIAAGNIVNGDAKAVVAGYSTMTNPSASEVSSLLVAAKKEFNDVAPADREYDAVQKELDALREPTDELIREVYDHLKFAFRKESASNARRLLRTYGFQYSYLKGEPKEEEQVVPENN